MSGENPKKNLVESPQRIRLSDTLAVEIAVERPINEFSMKAMERQSNYLTGVNLNLVETRPVVKGSAFIRQEDFEKIIEMVKLASKLQEDPSELITKILREVGI